jgi:hypothetical protein
MGVPFLFCTGYNTLNDADAALRNAPVLIKPVDPGQLVEAIATLLASRSGPEAGRG